MIVTAMVMAFRRVFRRCPARSGSSGALEQESSSDSAQDPLPPSQSASRDYFLTQRKTLDPLENRVVLILIQPDPGVSDLERFLKQLELTLQPAIRQDDRLASIPEEHQLLIIARIPAGNGESLLTRLAEVIRREEVAWCAGKKEAGTRSSVALAVYPTDGTEFQALMNLARRRLERGICWNIQPPA